MEFNFQNPTRIIFGGGALAQLRKNADGFGPARALLVTGRTAMRKSGVTGKIISELGTERVAVFDQVEPNPSAATVDRGVEICRKEKCGLIIGLGGGSPLDAAKAIAALVNNPGRAGEYLEGKELKHPGLPLIAIPTTSGSGSEVTPFAILTIPEKHLKYSLRNQILYPRVAIIDPLLTASLPPRQTAATGLDVLAHALESLWSKNHQPLAALFAERAIELIFLHLVRAYRNGEDAKARIGMAEASMLGGLAISQTGTTAIHPASYPLTYDFGFEHGLACAIFIPSFLRINRPVLGDRFARLLRILALKDLESLEEKIRNLMMEVEAPICLREIGVKEKDIPQLAERGIGKSTVLNPVELRREDLEKILKEIF
jgi:alcohol dehydrogenase